MNLKYGVEWPDVYHDAFIEMVCAKKWKEYPYCDAQLDHPAEHLLRACRMLLDPRDFTISRWTEQHAVDWCETDFCITWGAAATSKSNDYGIFSVLDWATDPTETVTLMASTTREMLKLRSYESVVRYFKLLKRNRLGLPFPGKESKTTTAILNTDDDDVITTTVKASIRGVAVNDGGTLQGAHLPYVRLILDELSEMKAHGMNARANLGIGCRNFKVFGLANPTSFYDEAAKYSVPRDGWASVSVDHEVWETRWGRVRHHDGLKSPAVVEPGGRERYPYLVNQEQIDRRLREEDGNAEARDFWIFVRGYPPRSGVDDTVLTPELVQTHKMQGPPAWVGDDLIYVAGLDPAFTSGGDDCILKIGAVGRFDSYLMGLAFVETIRIPIDSMSPRPATYQVIDGIRPHLERYGLIAAGPRGKETHLERLCCDDSGTQSVADVITVELGPGVLRVNNGSSATDMPVSPQDVTPMKDKYCDLGTETWLRMAALGRENRLRGLTDRSSNEFCIRRLVVSGRRKRLEKKSDFKARLKGHRSPDDGDASALCAWAARPLLGAAVATGAHGPQPHRGPLGIRIVSTVKTSNYVLTPAR